MSERWNDGLQHFSRGNYYAARDLWEAEAIEVLSLKNACRVANGLAAVYRQILGPVAARSYMEQAYALSQKTEIDTSTRVKILSNMGILLCYLGHVKDGWAFCHQAFSMIEPSFPHESFTALNAYVYALTCAEAYQEVWDLRDEFERFSDRVNHEQLVRLFSPSFYSNIGMSAEMVGKLDEAMYYAQKSCGGSTSSSYMVNVVTLYLKWGRYEEAFQHVPDIYHICVGTEAIKDQRILARAIEILGWVADFSGQSALAKRCIEKAELYFGQLGQWDDWLKMRDYQIQGGLGLTSEFLMGEELSSFLDNLTLLDGVKLMFPDVSRISQLATDLAVRTFRRLPAGHDQSLLREMQLAGRLSQIGLNALAVNEIDAKRLLLSDEKCIEMTELGLKLLESYPHTAVLRDLIAGARLPRQNGGLATTNMCIASQCLAISFHYVKAVELQGMNHVEALRSVVNHPMLGTYSESLGVFMSDMTFDSEVIRQ